MKEAQPVRSFVSFTHSAKQRGTQQINNDKPTAEEVYADHLRMEQLLRQVTSPRKGYDEATFSVSSNQATDLSERFRPGDVITVTIDIDTHPIRMAGKVKWVEFRDHGWELCLAHVLTLD